MRARLQRRAEHGSSRRSGPLAPQGATFRSTSSPPVTTSSRWRMNVMVPRGHAGVHDVVAGSRTEHVVRDGRLPVLSVYAAS